MRRSLLTTEKFSGSVDSRMVALMRLLLASSALVIICLDPSEPDRFVAITYGALVLYTIYSITLYILVRRGSTVAEFISKWSHWADVGWYLVLIALSSGTSSIFFYFFFFSILLASFRRGFESGLRVVFVSSAAFTAVGYATAPSGSDFELNKFLLRPIYLCALGYMIAYWGGCEITLRRRLSLLREVSSLSNPRFGVRRTIGAILERVRAFYNAHCCVLVLADPDTDRYTLRRADRVDPEAGMRAELLTAEMRNQLLALPDNYAVVYDDSKRRWAYLEPSYYAYDLVKGERSVEGKESAEALADLFGARSYVSVPVYFRSELFGRLYIAAERPHVFTESDADFLLQAIDQILPVIDNIRLVDRLASHAAEEERKKIARDIHDSIVQPYIGLQIALDSLVEILTRADMAATSERLVEALGNVSGRVKRIRQMSETGISDLRRYVSGLTGVGKQEASLLPSVRRYAAKFSEATGIAVQVEASSEIRVNDRLAAELFQIVIEGLSNIRRHTQSPHAAIQLDCSDNKVTLIIQNETTDEGKPLPFIPRSISERASALGGQVHIEQHEGIATSVMVEVPL